MILQLSCAEPKATLSLLSDSSHALIHEIEWEAHRQLSTTLTIKIKELLEHNQIQLSDLTALFFCEGPGSYTGLRVGGTFINVLGSLLGIPVFGGRGDNWTADAISRLQQNRPGIDLIYDKPLYAKLPVKN
jgi:tRNA threonylcarbamoyl adenosine modification protein YeaZ